MSVVVIGGGLAGLNAALIVQEAGLDVELYEASDNVGGRVRTDYIDGYTLDHGFQLINDSYSELHRLDVIRELNLVPISRTIDVMTPLGVTSISDPRSKVINAAFSPLGSLLEKFAFIRYMNSTSRVAESCEQEMVRMGLGDMYLNVLKPFLRGVFLTDLTDVDASYAKDVISTFIRGKSALPQAGAGVLSEALAARIENIHLNHRVTTLNEFAGKKIIIATDAHTASALLGTSDDIRWASSTTWYHSLPTGQITDINLRISSADTPLVNSIALSNTVSDYAPASHTLISTTSLNDLTDEEVQCELLKFWGVTGFTLIKKYSIQNSLPIFQPGQHQNARTSMVRESVFIAGDYLSASTQNAALLSGRLAATELLATLER
jgi:hypothetical protein